MNNQKNTLKGSHKKSSKSQKSSHVCRHFEKKSNFSIKIDSSENEKSASSFVKSKSEKNVICDASSFKNDAEKIFEINHLSELLTDETTEKMFLFAQHLTQVNRVINLTAIVEQKDVILKHFVDSLTISKFIPKNAKLIDVGCGAGFPSLPLAIFRPDLDILSVDSTDKKIKFVNASAELLGLDNIRGVSLRAEDAAHSSELRERFDVAVARAVAPLPILAELCLPFVKVGGDFLAMKSKEVDGELALASTSLAKLGVVDIVGDISNISLFLNSDISEKASEDDATTNDTLKRNIIIVKKSAETPKEFPRQYSQIKKSPL